MADDRPWENEPDSLDFEADGLPCVMRRGARGVWCGYVGVPADHPLFGLPVNHLLKLPMAWFAGRTPLEGGSPIDIVMHAARGKAIDEECEISLALEVHGGVNYAEDHVGDHPIDDRWWFGFDCGHAWDRAPNNDNISEFLDVMVESMPEHVRDTMRRIVRGDHNNAKYRDQQYVVAECQSLAAQLNAIAKVIQGEPAGVGTHDRRA